MSRRRLGLLKVSTFVAVALGILLVGEMSQAIAEGWLTAEENAMAKHVNEHRQAQGLKPLGSHSGLKMVARRQAQRMVLAGKIYHNPNLEAEADEAVPDWLILGENVGVGPDEPSVHEAFLASPAHRENIELPDFNILGLGAMAADDGSMYFTQNFAESRAAVRRARPQQQQQPARPRPRPPVVRVEASPAAAVQSVAPKPKPAVPKPSPSPSPSPSPEASPIPTMEPTASESPEPQPESGGAQAVTLFNGLAAMLGEALEKIGRALAKLAFWR